MGLSGELVTTFSAFKLPHSFVSANMDTQLFNSFECFPTDLAEVWSSFLMPASNVPQKGPFLREPLITKLTAEGAFTSVCAVVLIQTRLCPECLPTEVALERFLACVRAEVHVEVGFLGEGVMAELTHIGALVSVFSLDVHL